MIDSLDHNACVHLWRLFSLRHDCLARIQRDGILEGEDWFGTRKIWWSIRGMGARELLGIYHHWPFRSV